MSDTNDLKNLLNEINQNLQQTNNLHQQQFQAAQTQADLLKIQNPILSMSDIANRVQRSSGIAMDHDLVAILSEPILTPKKDK